jgi:hypothetical protein
MKSLFHMTQADSELSAPSTNTTTTRRSFLSRTAGGAAGVAVPALATIPPASAVSAQTGLAASPDPVFALIADHKKIKAEVDAIEAELVQGLALGTPQSDGYDPIAEPASVEMDLFLELIEAVPATLAGAVALVIYLDQVNKKDPWKFEDNYATPLIGALATAFNRIGVA